jgi:hypothetical protein
LSYKEIIKLIQRSQQKENAYIDQVKRNAQLIGANRAPTLTVAEANALIAKINEEGEYRETLYALLADLSTRNKNLRKAYRQLRDRELRLAELEEKLLNDEKADLNNKSETQQNQMKMVNINQYYSNVYQYYGKIARAVAVVLVLLLLTVPFRDAFPGLTSTWTKLVVFSGTLYILYLFSDFANRRNDNFNEYTFGYAPTSTETLNKPEGAIQFSGLGVIPSLCAGKYCCGPGTMWDSDYGCVQSDPTNINA